LPAVPALRPTLLTAAAMLAFAGNSLLCRAALAGGAIDAASFTGVRVLSGAVTLWALSGIRSRSLALGGDWTSALALFGYAAGFSFAYVSLPAGTGALLLFGAVQATMIAGALRSGERFGWTQWLGSGLAIAGLVGLVLPGLGAPPLLGSGLMLGAGLAWGVYSLRGRGAGDATAKTAGNFVRAVPMALVVAVAWHDHRVLDPRGVWLAIASGAVASGLGYAIWYTVLPSLRAGTAATVQLCVPVIAAFGGVVLLAEPVTPRLVLATLVILGGIALFVTTRRPG
jgi:drug/metabolite transporter (DMT)-like permease